MKKAFVISFFIHLAFLLGIFTASYVLKASAKPIYPQVYQVSLVSLPAAAPEATESQEMTGPQVPEEKPKPEPSPKKAKPPEKKKPAPTPAKTASPKTNTAGLPKGMKIVSSEGGVPSDSYYLALILSKISRNWNNPYQGKKETVRAQIYFRIDKNGKLQEVKIENSSGDAIFDQSALRAVYDAKIFPPLPEEMKLSNLGVHFEFEYVK
ncbi:TonB C-terminal domain-containing protein [candidate division TA06 bacterium]|uniref:TonB C-terminal domain-containing protein n=1 Tax=candidate division TA06 bacterium TaxID=2250710 RepID=A0A933I9Z6_UNCT6|nr:TonB C-terminal domain-containing protein [candidate division TA06 bacterium]